MRSFVLHCCDVCRSYHWVVGRMVSQSVPYHFQQRPMTLCNVNPWQSLDGLHILLFLEPANLANRTAHTVDLTWQKMWYGNKGFCGKVHGKMMTLFLHDPWRRWSKSFLIFRCVAAPQRPCVKETHRVLFGPEIRWSYVSQGSSKE